MRSSSSFRSWMRHKYRRFSKSSLVDVVDVLLALFFFFFFFFSSSSSS
jgi:hypothetical protein